MVDFNFLTDAPAPKIVEPPYMGPNLSKIPKMTPRKFASTVLEVYDKLGGASWLITQAVNDPRAFLELLKKMIPKSIQLDDLTGIQVHLIDQFGNEISINTKALAQQEPSCLVDTGAQVQSSPDTAPGRVTEDGHPESGPLQIATGGTSLPGSDSSALDREDPIIEIQDMFE